MNAVGTHNSLNLSGATMASQSLMPEIHIQSIDGSARSNGIVYQFSLLLNVNSVL